MSKARTLSRSEEMVLVLIAGMHPVLSIFPMAIT